MGYAAACGSFYTAGGIAAVLGVEGFDGVGELEVFGGDAAGFVGGEVDVDFAVDVEPFGVVVLLFSVDGDAAHEAKGGGKVGEFELLVQFAVA